MQFPLYLNLPLNLQHISVPSMFWLSLLLAIVAFCATTALRGRQKQTLPLPPGPRRKFIIGNLSDLPSPGQQDWHHWTEHKERYGMGSALGIEMTSL
jgi:hypothetical protein